MTRPALLLLLLAGCAHGTAAPAPAGPIPVTLEALAADSIASAMVRRAFDADAKLADPDSLYIPNAEVIANGAPRAEAPRLAGVAEGGTVQLGSSRFSVTGNYVWGTMQYRWVPGVPEKRIVDGWATFVIARLKTGEWRILHVHSSTASPEP